MWDPDLENYRDVTLPRWPADVTPAAGGDGHADIVDPVSGIIHSFWRLRNVAGQWVAAQYAWSRMDGSGWGDPAHYYQGGRATGVPTMAGMIRKHEVDDGQPLYRHALSMSLTYSGLAASPAYVYPATSADNNAASTNLGKIPEGSLVMLPPAFDTGQLESPALRKVAETLKAYGAYAVDRNDGTPFYIYVENGAAFDLHPKGWSERMAADLHKMRTAMRRVVGVAGWRDGNGDAMTPQANLNLLSMRGEWLPYSGPRLGEFDSWRQAVVYPSTPNQIVQVNYSNRGLNPVSWALPVGGNNYRLTAVTTGGGKFRLQLRAKANAALLFDSGEMVHGAGVTFAWPTQPVNAVTWAISGTGQPSSIRADLLAIAP